MYKRSCQNCLFEEGCPYNRPCSHFSPIDESDDRDYEMIERGRELFAEEWSSYISESGDSYF